MSFVTVMLAALATGWPVIPQPSASTLTSTSTTANADAAVIAGTSELFLLPDIPGAAESATDWYRHLTGARGVPVDKVHLLRDADVTRERLLDAVTTAAGQVGPGGTLWIVFIGHGAPALDGGDGLLLGVDVQPNERSIQERGVSQSALLTASRGGQARTVAVFDACFSGVTASGPLVPGAQFTLPARRVEAGAQTVIFSASDETAGPLPGHDRPAFSYLLLGALSGWADVDGDGVVMVNEAHAWVSTTLLTVVRTRRQVPSLRGAVDDQALSRAVARAPDLAAIVAGLEPGRVVTPSSPSPSPSPSPSAIAAYREREIRMSADRLWVRGNFATALADDDLIDAGGDGAPKAAQALKDIRFREQSQTLIWVLPPVGGMVVGAGLGVVAGAINAASGTDNPERGYLLGSFIGTFAGASLGALAVSLPLGMWALLDDEDRQRQDNARAELATAANAAERKRAGLIETP